MAMVHEYIPAITSDSFSWQQSCTSTILVHWWNHSSCTPGKLIAAAQTATYAWGGLAIATGAAMTYFLSYWYNRG
jgi:hypothetical protein